MNWFWDNISLILGAAGALAVAFLTPLGKQVIDRLFSRKPAFSVKSSVLDTDLLLVVEPANNSAKKKRPLGVRVRGINAPNAADPAKGASGIRWLVDLSRIDGITEILKIGEDYDLQFFFKADNPSDKTTVRFIGKHKNNSSATRTRFNVKTATELVSRILPNSNITCEFAKDNISRTFPTSTSHIQWSSVHDGKEITFSDVSDLEISGNTTLLADPRYAWVMAFRNCHNIAIRGLTLGHTEAGYCQGGVIKFDSCTNVILDECNLFGSGTIGLQLNNCTDVEIIGTKIRECTYGAVKLNGTTNTVFRDCDFSENEGFELFEISEPAESIMIKHCTFFKNKMGGAIFYFDDLSYGADLFVNDSTFSSNTFGEFTNNSAMIAGNDNKLVGNIETKGLWVESRQRRAMRATTKLNGAPR